MLSVGFCCVLNSCSRSRMVVLWTTMEVNIVRFLSIIIGDSNGYVDAIGVRGKLANPLYVSRLSLLTLP